VSLQGRLIKDPLNMYFWEGKTDLTTLFNHSRSDLLESLSDILRCSNEQIEDSISKLELERPEDILLQSFFKSLGLDTNNKKLLFKNVAFDKLIMSHLSSRLSEPKDQRFLNLHQVLTEETDLCNLFLKYGVRFEIRKKRIITYYKDVEVNWDDYSSYEVARVKKRLLLFDKFKDKCINGFLFNDQIWKDHRVTHLYDRPEILGDISNILGIQGIVDEWRERAGLYCVGVVVKINDIYFDGIDYFSLKSKVFYTYKQSMFYLKMSKNGV
jgi:hypothetical protein